MIDDIDGKLSVNKMQFGSKQLFINRCKFGFLEPNFQTKALTKSLQNHDFELDRLKSMENEIYTLKVCVGGILGRELGLGNGELKDDQIEVSDASAPELSW